MRNFLAVMLAAFLAVSTAAPSLAADRPVGPETGQARTSDDPGGIDIEHPSDDEANVLVPNSEISMGWDGWWCRVFRWFAGAHNPAQQCSRGVIRTN